ncbi:MAG: 4-(cytidine 5'-diphospho)-2-C-methyl-D-erythritol kinase [Candidatus Omnitrophota bacterium]|nr:4-(cytidine 5'-diphospho)-2-C-methyl-D-erythritol kinase [Candidatus Omnitrophota bacterium]
MTSITVKAPAKVNLFLKILSKRKDSYHNIHTLFERISLADTIKISRIPKGIIVKSDKFLTKNPKDNLVYKAAEAILKHGKVKSGVRIEIKKRIPVAAGLGGGSSDAASTLIGVNKLFNIKLNSRVLMQIGSKIGADVPFFILGTPFAAGKGTGCDLDVVKTSKKLWHLLIYPGFKVNTKDVYRAFDGIKHRESKCLTLRRCSGSSAELLPKYLTARGSDVKMVSPLTGYRDMEQMLYNDLERATVLRKEIIGCILESLAQLLGRKFIVSGSGPSLFCLYSTGKEAKIAKQAVLRSVPAGKRRGWQIFVVQTS